MPIEPCEIKGPCDYPNVRNDAVPGSGTPMLTVNTAVHVHCTDGGLCWQTQQEVDDFMCLVNDDFAPWKIQFDYTTYFHNDTAAWDPNDAPVHVKDVYAALPDRTLNIFLTMVSKSGAVFPWSPNSLAARGGVVLDSFADRGLTRRIPTH